MSIQVTGKTDTTMESAVMRRYSAGADASEAALCCPVSYDPTLLKVIPDEIIERDYGCGNPSEFVRSGDTVLDLGSGGGKICYIASQVVGPKGRVIGVDFNTDMLALAREHQPQVASRIGYDNVEFRRGRLQDYRGIRAAGLDQQGGLHHQFFSARLLKNFDLVFDQPIYSGMHDRIEPLEGSRVAEYHAAQLFPIDLTRGGENVFAKGLYDFGPAGSVWFVNLVPEGVGVDNRRTQTRQYFTDL